MDTLDLEMATEFLLIAATLVELKTKRPRRRTRTWTSTTSLALGRSAPPAGPAVGVQDLQGRSQDVLGAAQHGGPIGSAALWP
ncbi:MAG: hypothetical protein R2789_07380 [Microthrixaceae bacterium]